MWKHYTEHAAAVILIMPRYHLYHIYCQFASPLPLIMARQMTAKLADRHIHSPLLQTSLKDRIIQRADYKTDAHPQSIFTATHSLMEG